MKANHLRVVKLVCLCLFCLLACLRFTGAFASSINSSNISSHISFNTSSGRASVGDDENCVKCHTQSTGRASEVVKIHLSSAHGRAGVGCNDCHGGDPAQTEKAKAHSTNLVAKPDRNATLAMCGACHQPQLAQFKTSKHFPEKQGTPRLDCAECHGAHAVGNPPEAFSIGQFCVSCHGLEYLPALPQQLQDLLNLSDDLRDAFNRLTGKGHKPSEEVIKQRKEIRRLTAEIIHPTDLKGGITRIPQILSQGEKLKRQIRVAGGR